MSKRHFLEFEQPIAELDAKIEELRYVQNESAVDISEEISRLEAKGLTLTKDIYAKLSPWQIALVARHPQRPYTLDYIQHIFTDFEELHGDRAFADDMRRRDERDADNTHRADDAIEVDTTSLSLDEVIDRIEGLLRERVA